jgi:hypothetical protein
MKIVINKCYGGFSISKEAAQFMANRGNKRANKELTTWDSWSGHGYVEGMDGGYDRADPDLVAAVKKLGDKANGTYADLSVVEIPDGIEYTMEEYDGIEWIAEKHRTWR